MRRVAEEVEAQALEVIVGPEEVAMRADEGTAGARHVRVGQPQAGHVPPLLVRDGRVSHLRTGGTLVGMDIDSNWQSEVCHLQAGDVILAYTDGLSEAMNFQDEMFGYDRVERALLAGIDLGRGARAIAQHVLWEMRRFAGLQKRFDDLIIVVVKVL